MTRSVKLSRVGTLLADHDYPTTRRDAMDAFDDVTLLFADGQAPMDETLSEVPSDTFDSAEDLEMELYSQLPIEAVGEPGQSEGEG
ncbi:hypothetical protein [Halomarina ordinaria]|uniref:DUF2795 domain-containing protein n=1 Tax=Halomarina ordinaria TaxID=3033939 RepID=A0ABD5UAR2_9EURY|nr:hypothetical protein [Halomarina sp. PSRA2]